MREREALQLLSQRKSRREAARAARVKEEKVKVRVRKVAQLTERLVLTGRRLVTGNRGSGGSDDDDGDDAQRGPREERKE